MSSPETQTTVYFITGANRGIGLGIVTHLLSTSSATHPIHVFAGARSTSPQSALTLLQSAPENKDRLTIVPFVAADEASNKSAAQVVEKRFGRVDVVLGVAGIADYVGSAGETPADVMAEHFKINATGILVLFQAFQSLLKKSPAPKFIPFSSGVGSLTAYIAMPVGFTCYGASKVALNYIARKIHYENEWLTCFPLSPGIVETDMAYSTRIGDKSGAIAAIQDAMSVKPDVAAKLIVELVESATRETHGGEFVDAIDGSKIAW